jgi:uncharacterized protein
MMRIIGRLPAGAAALLFAIAASAAAPSTGEPIPVPSLTAHVVDLTGTLTAAEREQVDAKLRDFEQRRGSQVAVLLVPTIGTEAIEDFATRVTDSWQLGRKGVDDGVLFVIAKQERKMRIQTGRGVQGTLTDILSKRIVADIVSPRFRTGDFAGGIDEGVDAIMKAIEGEDLPLPAKKPQRKVDTVSSYGDFVWIAFFLVPVVAMVLRGIVGRFAGAGLTGGVTGLAAGWIFGSVAFGVIAAILAFVFGLFAGTGVGRGVRGGGWGGGFGGGGGGFGGGGGGFSGGGGGFDGGGASGEW